MFQFFILITTPPKDNSEKRRYDYGAKLDVWQNMAYFVAKELGMRPIEILNDWSCEELLVAFGVYGNQMSAKAYEMTPKQERRKKQMTELDRYVMPFFTETDLAKLYAEPVRKTEPDDMEKIANIIFG